MTDGSGQISAAAVSSREDEGWHPDEVADLAKAVATLEGSSFAARVNELVDRQIGVAVDVLPEKVVETAKAAAGHALEYAMRAVSATLAGEPRPAASRLHLAAVTASGAIGGAFGLLTLPLELPVSTALILRSVAEIAREEGEDLASPEARLACLEVFALGGREPARLGESSYFAARALLAKSVSEAARYMAQRGLMEESAPALVRLFAQVASRFGLVVTQKVVAQTVPLLGALTGAAINAAFMEHFQKLARAHFVVRRLERRHGAEAVRRVFERLRDPAESRVPTRPSAVDQVLLGKDGGPAAKASPDVQGSPKRRTRPTASLRNPV